jgi:hypothetical protein
MSSPAPADAKRSETRPVQPAPSQPHPSITTAAVPNGGVPPSSPNDGEGLGAALASEPSGSGLGNKDRSNAIDKGLEDDSKKFKRECKILLLGESRRGGPGRRARLMSQDRGSRGRARSSSR